MYFSDTLRLKREDGFFVFSFRISEKKVEIQKIPIDKVEDLQSPTLNEWCGSSVFKIKKRKDKVLLKFHTNVYRADLYCLTLSEFKFLQSLYLSIEGV